MEDIFSTDFLDLGKDGVQAAVTTVEDTTGVFDDYLVSPLLYTRRIIPPFIHP